MTYKEIVEFSRYPAEFLTNILVELFREIDREHTEFQRAFGRFGIDDVVVDANGRLHISGVETRGPLTKELRERNYEDYAAVVYMISTGQRSAESMQWDAGEKVKIPVLREIVCSFSGCAESIEPLVAQLREGYTDEAAFFYGYKTVDQQREEKELNRRLAFEASERAEEARENRQNKLFGKPAVKYGIGGFWLVILVLAAIVLRMTVRDKPEISIPPIRYSSFTSVRPDSVGVSPARTFGKISVDSLRMPKIITNISDDIQWLESINEATERRKIESLKVKIALMDKTTYYRVRPKLSEYIEAKDWERADALIDSAMTKRVKTLPEPVKSETAPDSVESAAVGTGSE